MLKISKKTLTSIAFITGLIIFTVIVFNLSTGWFVIVISAFAAIILGVILISKEDK